MTRKDLIRTLKENNIDTNIIIFEDTTSDGYGLRSKYFGWETYIRERGKDYNILGFPSESDALEHILKEIMKIKNATEF